MADVLDAWQADEESWQAWRIYQSIVSRFTVDGQAIGHALAKLTEHYSAEEFQDVIDRLALIYDTLHPPKKQRETS